MKRRNRRLGVEKLEARDLFPYRDLDTSFGAKGVAATPFFKAQLSLDKVADATLQTDGKIVSVGSVLIGNSNLTGRSLSRGRPYLIPRSTACLSLATRNLGRWMINLGMMLSPAWCVWTTLGNRSTPQS